MLGHKTSFSDFHEMIFSKIIFFYLRENAGRMKGKRCEVGDLIKTLQKLYLIETIE